MGRLVIFLFWVGLVIALPPTPSAAGAEINLLHSNNITGHLFPCPT